MNKHQGYLSSLLEWKLYTFNRLQSLSPTNTYTVNTSSPSISSILTSKMVTPRVCGWHDSNNEHIKCDCLMYVIHPAQNPNTAVRCQDCGHYKSWHDNFEESETDIVQDIMKKCKAKLGTIMKTKTTKVEAMSEALQGLRKDMRKDMERTKTSVFTINLIVGERNWITLPL